MKGAQSTPIPSRQHSPSARWIATLALLWLPACGMAETDEQIAQKPNGTEVENLNPAAPPASAEAKASQIAANEVIVECERHIQAWQIAQSGSKSETDRNRLQALELAFGTYVLKELTTITDVAISGPERSRGIASTSLGFSKDPTVLQILLNNLTDRSDQVVANTLFGLAILGDPNIPISSVGTILKRPSASAGLIRNAAFTLVRLAQVRATSTPPASPSEKWEQTMLLLLNFPEPSIRAQGATGLGYLKATNALPRLSDLLAGDPESRVRFAAAFALGQLGSKTAAVDLIAALDDPDTLVAGASRAALSKIFGQDFGPKPHAWELLLANSSRTNNP